MQNFRRTNESWIYQITKYKTSILGGIFAIISLSLSHYAGFLMKVPLQIVSVAGGPLAKGVTATFLFYVFFCAVSARVVSSIFQIVLLPMFVLNDRMEGGIRRKMTWRNQRRFVRFHTQTIKREGYYWLCFQAILFLLFMLAIYVKFSMTWVSGLSLLLALIMIVLSGLVRSGFFLQPSLLTFIRKNRTRPVRLGRAASATFVTASSALVVIAFILGGMRASLLRDQNSNLILTKEFKGMATIIASSDNNLLLFQKQGKDFRYIYSAAEFTASIETAPVFSPLGGNSK